MQNTPPRPSRWIPWIVTCSLFMENLDSTILTTAIPVIARDFVVGPLQLKMALTAYLISLAIFIPASGWVAEAYGFRRVFCSALLGFTLGSLLCGCAQTLPQMVVARMVQGVGGAMMVPVARFLLMRSYPKNELVRMTNLVTLPALIGPALGPLLGGAITTYGHWRFIFLLNLPVGAFGLWAARTALPKDYGRVMPPFDARGFALCGLGLCGLSFGVELFGEPYVSTSTLSLLWAFSMALLIAYGLHAHGHPAPFLRLSLFQVPTFRLGIAASIASRLGVGGVPFLLPLLYQTCFGFSPLASGLMILPLSLGMLTTKLLATPLLRRFGFRHLLMTNTVLLAAATAQFSTLTQSSSVEGKLFAAFVYGCLASVQFSCMNVLAYVDIEKSAMGDATSIFSTVQQFSTGLGVGFSAVCVSHLMHTFKLSMAWSFHGTFAVMAVLTLLSTTVFARLPPNAGNVASGHVPVRG